MLSFPHFSPPTPPSLFPSLHSHLTPLSTFFPPPPFLLPSLSCFPFLPPLIFPSPSLLPSLYFPPFSLSPPSIHSFLSPLSSHITSYKHELKEWDEVIEQKTLGVEDAKRTFESERDVDFRQLHCDDVETLKSYLTPEQSSLLEKPLLGNPQFRLEAEKQLDAIVSMPAWAVEINICHFKCA